LFRSTKPNGSGTAGFTLIEALAALVVASAGISAIGSLLYSTSRSDLDAEHHIALIAAAQNILAGLPERNGLADGQLFGILDNHQWRVEASPFVSSSGVQAAVWEPQRIALRVHSPGGAVLDIDTVRLRKRTLE
jgi:general secretion pathway protein I